MVLAILTGALALSYAAFAATPFILGPTLSLSLEAGTGPEVYISGTTSRVSSVWLNDLPIPISDQGSYAVTRTFPPGYTEVVVRAEDRFGRSREQRQTIVTTHFIDHASQENDIKESNQEHRSGSAEGNEGGEESSN